MSVRIWVTPLGDRVVVAPNIEVEENVEQMFALPEASAKEKPQESEVIAVGPGRYTDNGVLIPMHLKVGDHVLHALYAGTEITLDGKTFLILREDECTGVVTREYVDEPEQLLEYPAQLLAAVREGAVTFRCLDAGHEGQERPVATHVISGEHGELRYCLEHAERYMQVITSLGMTATCVPPLEVPATTQTE